MQVILGRITSGTVGALLLLALTACATVREAAPIDPRLVEMEAGRQFEMALREEARLRTRLGRVHYRLVSSNADLCGASVRHFSGMTLATIDQFPRDHAEAYALVFQLGRRPSVMSVVPGSPADQAGLEMGDRLIEVDGAAVPSGSHASRWYGDLAKTIESGRAVSLVVERDGQRRPAVNLAPVPVCDYPVELVAGDRLNATANGRRIRITTAMMRFAERDEELALILGHELAHNVLEHMEVQKDLRPGGRIFGGILAALAQQGGGWSQQIEAEADYAGIHYAARAGYDVSDVAAFWRRMAVAHPRTIHGEAGSHPSTPVRYLVLDRAAREIARKKAAGRPLLPEAGEEAGAQRPS